MLWFIPCRNAPQLLQKIFKYILCYGSSRTFKSMLDARNDLNTSYVMVHQRLQSVVAVHTPYLNTSYVMVHPTSCLNLSLAIHLNTSYVMVHPAAQFAERLGVKHLNTSYVMVHPGPAGERGEIGDLNTSYVMVHQCKIICFFLLFNI